MKKAGIIVVLLFLSGSAWAQADLSANLGPVIQPDKGWVQEVHAGPWCDGFTMQPSGRSWVIPRGTPMHDGILASAQFYATAWYLYRINPAAFNNVAPLVVVSASTSPPLTGSSHPGYDAVPTFQPSQTICGSANAPYQVSTEAAISILPASSY